MGLEAREVTVAKLVRKVGIEPGRGLQALFAALAAHARVDQETRVEDQLRSGRESAISGLPTSQQAAPE